MSPTSWPMLPYVANILLMYPGILPIKMLASNNSCLAVAAVPLYENPAYFVWASTDDARPPLILPSCSDTFLIFWSPIHGLQHTFLPLSPPQVAYFTWNGSQTKLFQKRKEMNFLYILTFEALSLFSLYTWFLMIITLLWDV